MFGSHRRRLVSVAYRDLASPPIGEDPTLSAGSGYVFLWGQRERPQPGMRVIVPGMDGPASGIVLGEASRRQAAGLDLKAVRRIATAKEIEAAHARRRAADAREQVDHSAWLDMARRAAGLHTPGRARTKAIRGYPVIPPAAGTASAGDADDYGRTWWRIYKDAERVGRPAEEIKAYRSIAHRWYAIRDKGGN